MLGLTTTRRLRRETEQLLAETGRLREERDAAREDRDAARAAARTSAEQFAAADAARQQLVNVARYRGAPALAVGDDLIEGGRTGAAVNPTGLALRERDRARALEARLAELQALNEQCRCAGLTPHTPRICACGHGSNAHTVAVPHSCTASDSTCLCRAYQQLPHAEALERLERNRQAAADRERAREVRP